jgi:hypothetical protein
LLIAFGYLYYDWEEWMEERVAGPGSLSILFFSTSKLVNAGATGGRVSLATADVVPGCVLTNNTGLIIRNKWRGIMSLFPLLSFFYLSLSLLWLVCLAVTTKT